MEQGCHDSEYSLMDPKRLLKRFECIRNHEGWNPLSIHWFVLWFIHLYRVQTHVEFIQNWLYELIKLSSIRSYRLIEDRGRSIWNTSARSKTPWIASKISQTPNYRELKYKQINKQLRRLEYVWRGKSILIFNNRHFSSNFLSLIQCHHVFQISELRDAAQQKAEIR